MKEWGSGEGKYLDFSLLLSSSLCWCLPLTKLDRKQCSGKQGDEDSNIRPWGTELGGQGWAVELEGQMEMVYHTDTQYEPRNVSGYDSAKRALKKISQQNTQRCKNENKHVVWMELKCWDAKLHTTLPRRLGHILHNMTKGICCGVENTSS